MTNKIKVNRFARAYLARIGQRGGEAGTGAAKRRGDRAHYRRLSRLRWGPPKS